MDKLYTRYNDPMAFLNNVITLGIWPKSLQTLYDRDTDDQLFNMYLHSFPNCSFNEWKQNIMNSNESKNALSDEEVATAVNDAEAILETLKNQF